MKVGLLQDMEAHEQKEARMLMDDGEGVGDDGVCQARLRCLQVLREIEEARSWYGKAGNEDGELLEEDQGRSYLQTIIQQDASTLATSMF
jgi:hypothetical protein